MSKSGPSAWLSYIAVRAVFAIMQLFPLESNLRTARWLARLWPRIMPRHRERAVAHLTASFGDAYTPERIGALADRCLESVTMFAVEAVCLPRLVNAETWSQYVRLVDLEETVRLIVDGRGLILVTAHYGSFELAGHLLACFGLDPAAVMRPLDNVYLNRMIVRSRQTHGMQLLDKKGATARAEELLAEGTLLAFIGDQDAGRKGVFVDFFGRQASTYKSIGLLAITTDTPIVVAYARRQGHRARYDVGVQRVIHPHEWADQDDPLRWVTQAYTSAIEAFVREAPEQYLWIHRRWKSQPRRRGNRSGRTPEGAGRSSVVP